MRSVGIGRILSVQDALHLLEMSFRKIGDLLPILRGPLGDIVGKDFQRLAGGVGLDQDLAGALKV